MFESQPTLELLFEQLGLEATSEAIEQFVQTHQIAAETKLHEAEFWSAGQRQFLESHWEKDDEWAIVVDELNQQLHVEAHSS